FLLFNLGFFLSLSFFHSNNFSEKILAGHCCYCVLIFVVVVVAIFIECVCIYVFDCVFLDCVFFV
ncbi:hypothetical protein, partial [Salmonella enterica]|uniref:hypothetical protein n=1 Tax=Salmonella enterica TaxID=28901 RepID=UPI0020C325ED